MTVTLSPETQKMLEERMKATGTSNVDDAVRGLLMVTQTYEQQIYRDPETHAAIRRGIEQAKAGLSRPWEEVKQELLDRHLKR